MKTESFGTKDISDLVRAPLVCKLLLTNDRNVYDIVVARLIRRHNLFIPKVFKEVISSQKWA